MRFYHLIVFDFSGTLSLAAVEFARPDRLVRILHQSGLNKFGIETPETFWSHIVNPTWEQASLTDVGYTSTIVQAVENYLPKELPPAEKYHLGQAAARFVRLYLSGSQIHPGWKCLLQDLLACQNSCLVIATDHYAEATSAIETHLSNLGFQADSILNASTNRNKVFIANSADLGVHKQERKYWLKIKRLLALPAIEQVILIDDFGANEQEMDSYAAREKIVGRYQKTTAVLQNVFQAPIHPLPFHVERRDLFQEGLEENFRRCIEEISPRIAKLVGIESKKNEESDR